jgi:hypothetical protein
MKNLLLVLIFLSAGLTTAHPTFVNLAVKGYVGGDDIVNGGLKAKIREKGQDTLKDYRPPLFFREDWKEIPAATPVTQDHVANKDLVLSLYGPGSDSIKKSHHPRPTDDPWYIWSGTCRFNWAVTLKNRTSYADLSSFARVVWRSKQSGMRSLHIILKLADGTWLVSDKCDGASKDWRMTEFNLADITWYELDITTMVEGSPVTNPNLSKVDEIGFTDLMRGGQSIACSRLDWIEVYGYATRR